MRNFDLLNLVSSLTDRTGFRHLSHRTLFDFYYR